MLPLAFAAGIAAAHRGGGYVLSQWAALSLGTCVCAALLAAWLGVRRDPAGVPSSWREPRCIAVAAVVGYATWSVLGIAWAADRFAAHEEAARTAYYAALLLLAATVARSRRQVDWAVGAWTAVACVVACATLWRLTDLSNVMFSQGRLLGTLGYPNGWAALLLAPAAPAIAIGSSRGRHPAARACLVGGATLLVLVATMTQSRGALAALACALIVTLLVAPNRTRVVASVGILGAAVGAAWPKLSEVYRVRPRTPPALREAVIADARLWLLGCAFVVMVVVALAALVDERVELSARVRRRIASVTWIVLAVAVLGAGVTFERSDLLVGRLDNVRDRSTSARVDVWRVALRDAGDHPVAGVGPGNVDATIYRYRERVHPRTPRQAHQLVLENLAERGIVGTALLLAAIGAITIVAARARARARDDDARLLVAGLAGACAGWLAHAQLDWIWQLSAVTVPIAVAAGSLLAAGTWATEQGDGSTGVARRWAIAMALVSVVLLVPLVVADRAMTDARRSLDSGRVADGLAASRSATTWAPHAPRAWQLRGRAHADLGDVPRATRAYETSRRRSPDHWRTHATAATFYAATGQQALADDARADAARLDPLGYDARAMARTGRDQATR